MFHRPCIILFSFEYSPFVGSSTFIKLMQRKKIHLSEFIKLYFEGMEWISPQFWNNCWGSSSLFCHYMNKVRICQMNWMACNFRLYFFYILIVFLLSKRNFNCFFRRNFNCYSIFNLYKSLASGSSKWSRMTKSLTVVGASHSLMSGDVDRHSSL